ncbi:MAG: nickel-dependent lactate racemase [bacterium]|nr:nickel-dependent lactate racemase [bacterium]
MNIRLDYGKIGLDVALPDDVDITTVEPKHLESVPDQFEAVRTALRAPIGSPPLQKLVKAENTVGIIFYDITRPTPDHIVIPLVLEELEAAGVPRKQITLFNATGTHRANSDEELRAMLGDEVVDSCRIVQNDAHDKDSHTLVGTTSSGNAIWIHKDFVDADVRILTGFIEPHFFAGFSGGGKAVMPGLALLETVMRNHNAPHIDHPNSTWGITHGNPIWEEIHEAAAFAPPSFLVNVALNRHKDITAVFAGDWEQAHEQGCAFVKDTAMVSVDEAFDIVITSNSGYPLDLNLYQAVKGMSAASQIVKQGGSIIIAAECWDGIPDHGPYGKLLREAESIEQLLETIRDPDFVMGDTWQAQIQALISQEADVYVYSDGLDNETVKGAMLQPCESIEASIATLLKKYNRKARICILPEGPQTIPYIKP